MTSKKTLISVVIPFHNRIDLTSKAVDSVFSQTYQEFEIILVNDGSTEALGELNRIKDARLQMLSQPNLGPASARNTGIKAAQGDFVAFLDSDDLFLPEKLERQIDIHFNKPDIAFSHTNYFLVDQEDEILRKVVTSEFTGKVIPRLYYDCPIAMPTVMINRAYLTNENQFVEAYRISEDIIFYSRVIGNKEISSLDEPLTKVRSSETSANNLPAAQIIGARNILDYLSKYHVLKGNQLRFVRSQLLANMAMNYLISRDFLGFIINAARAFSLSPLHSNVISRSWQILQPDQYIKKRLK
jgi:glycosyltransferase involved in cell wall biosynthesis